MNRFPTVLIIAAFAPLCACRSTVQQTDRDVYRLIDERQRSAVGIAVDSRVAVEETEAPHDRAYAFTPQPRPSGIPAPFDQARPPAATSGPGEPEPKESAEGEAIEPDDTATVQTDISVDIFTPEQRGQVRSMTLADALAFAMRNAREFQDAKEDLYLAALDLTLERHLWTPQFVASVQTRYDDFADGDTLDRALSTVSELAVSQRLPYGGDITARVVHSLVRDVSDAVAKGETGQAILSAGIPLLRGGGRTAYESRYDAERKLVYAVRRFERFRRSFLVDVAEDYFNLQQLKAAIVNTHTSYLSRKNDWKKADFIHRMGQSRTIFDAPRAKANFRAAEAALVSAKERYETALDRFKIRLAMPVDALLDVASQEMDDSGKAVDAMLPDVDEATAVAVATDNRLDLLTSLDQVDDARRGVSVAANAVLPDLDLSADVVFDSDPEQLRAASLRSERTAWNAGLSLRIDDRKREKNEYRRSQIDLRRATRGHEAFADTVRADVRRALRRIAQQDNLRIIQELNVAENASRLAAADAQYNLGRSTNQDVVDASNDLLQARNNLASAISDYRIAILQFRRDTGTLRVTDDGRWASPDDFATPIPGAGGEGP